MEIRQLEYLSVVTEEGSFTRAAERLHVSQPAISAQVLKLERELGETLLDRSGPRVVATSVGEAVLQHARSALIAVASVRATVTEHAGLLTGRASVGVIGSGVPSVLPDLLASYAREHPAVELRLVQDASGALLDGLTGGDLDVAVVGLADDAPVGIESVNLLDGAVAVAVAHDHPLARRRSVRFAELAAYPLIVQPHGSGVRAAVDDALGRLRERPRIAYEAVEPRMLAELAARGLGVAVVPEQIVPEVTGVVAVRLTGPALRARVELAWPVDRPVSPAGRALVAHLRQGLAPGA